MISKLGYRDDIDGLRAIAVLSVVFYHAGLGFPGGYVGVDVFFVISGYLITALILKDLERGTFSMSNFWERRIRRIFPALAVMVAATMLAGWFLLLPEDLAKLGASVVAQSLLVSNFYFWRTTNYFGGANDEKPLLHTWSLAVEEQFYLIFPIALLAFWWAWSRWQKAQADRILGTTNHTNFPEKVEPPITQIDTDGSKEAGLRLVGPAGASESDSLASELADSPVSESLTRSADTPSSLPATSYPPPVTSPVGDNRSWALFWIFGAVAVVSFGISIWGVKAQPFATFFLLPTRAWELLIGSMLAVLPAAVVCRSAILREILCLVGLAGIFLPVFFYGEQTPFPGLTALPPCLGTAALIWANSHSSGASKRGWIVKVLSWKPIVLIGLISYSLYLWHWPVICFTSYWAVAAFNIFERWGMVGVSFVLALISWKLVETPCRYRLQNKSHTISLAILGSTLLLSLGYLYIFFNGFPERMPEQAQAFLKEIAIDSQKRKEYSHISRNFTNLDQLETGKLSRIGEDKIDSPDFILLGDSHAQCMVPVFDSFAKKHGISGVVVTYQGTPPFKSWPHQFDVAPQNADLIFEKVNKFISKNGVKNVFLSAYWSNYLRHGGIVAFSQALEESVRELQNNGANVFLVLDYPENEHNPIRSFLRDTFFPTASQFFACHAPPCFSKHWEKNSAVKEIANRLQIKLIDSSENLYDSKRNFYYVVKDGRPVYFDKDHLTIFGAEKSLGAKLDAICYELGYKTPK